MKIPFTHILLLTPSLAGTLLFFILPFTDVLRRSFLNSAGTNMVGLENYEIVISNEVFRSATAHTLLFLIAGLPLLLVLSFGAALLLEKATPVRRLAKTALLVPLALPAFAVSLIVALFFNPEGLINEALCALGLPPCSWHNEPTPFILLITLYLWKNIGLAVLLWLAAFARIPRHCLDAASLDGASFLRRVISVTLPLTAPTAALIATLGLANAFKMYREIYLLFGTYPPESIYLLPHLFANWFASLSLGKLAAGTVLIVGPFVLVVGAGTISQLRRRNRL